MIVKENIKINKIFLIQEKINKLCGMWEKLESVQGSFVISWYFFYYHIFIIAFSLIRTDKQNIDIIPYQHRNANRFLFIFPNADINKILILIFIYRKKWT